MPLSPPSTNPPPALSGVSFSSYTATRRAHWEHIHSKSRPPRGGRYYHKRLSETFRQIVPPGKCVLELGCGRGELLASLAPARGVGVDFSPAALQRAQAAFPHLDFVLGDAHTVQLQETFDYIILSDLLNDCWDVVAVLENLKPMTAAHTRILLNDYSHLWQIPLLAAQFFGLANRVLPQNWLTPNDRENMLLLAGLQPIRNLTDILVPLHIPLLSAFINKILGKLWPFHQLALTNILIARNITVEPVQPPPSVSIIVPARNEAGNIAAIFERTPALGSQTELLFIEGHSKDDTYAEIERQISAHPEIRARLFKQSGIGKADAVRLGFDKASGDVLMILDADMTVPPEDMVKFYEALVSGKGEFINGVRLVYPMEDQAMRFLNLLGNKFFSLAFTWLLGQNIKDTLCGTKVLWKKDYQNIAANRAYFGDFDPFGDFDLLFGAARLNQKIIEMPIRYRNRSYGETNISRWRHGLLLLRMVLVAARKIKFI